MTDMIADELADTKPMTAAAAPGRLRIGDIPIGVRLGAGFGLLIGLAALMGLVGLLYMDEINDRVESMYTQELVAIETLDDAKSALYRIRGDALEHILEDSPASMQRLASEIDEQQQRIDARIKQYRATRLAPEESVLVDAFEAHYTAYLHRVQKEILPLSVGGRDSDAEKLARGAAVEEFRKARVAMNELMDYNLTRAGKRYRNSALDFREALWTMVGIIAAITLFGGLMSYLLTRAIVVPLRRMVGYFQEIARGKLDNRISVSRRDEIGRALLSLAQTQAKLASALNKRYQAEAELQRAHLGLEAKVVARTQELFEANQRLTEVDRLKSEFVASMSHELRTPLNSIIGFTGLVVQGLSGPVNEEQQRQLNMVYRSANHLLGLINDVLDVSRIEAGKMELHLESLDPAEIIQEAVESLRPMAKGKQLALHTDIPEQLPAARGDRKRVLQVLLNLINNAIKFTASGRIDVVCVLRGHKLEFSVADTGCGIRDEDKLVLFNAFQQVGAAKKGHQGTGLGLYLSQKLIVLLGGDISFESEFGKGSRFIVTLPVFEPERADA